MCDVDTSTTMTTEDSYIKSTPATGYSQSSSDSKGYWLSKPGKLNTGIGSSDPLFKDDVDAATRDSDMESGILDQSINEATEGLQSTPKPGKLNVVMSMFDPLFKDDLDPPTPQIRDWLNKPNRRLQWFARAVLFYQGWPYIITTFFILLVNLFTPMVLFLKLLATNEETSLSGFLLLFVSLAGIYGHRIVVLVALAWGNVQDKTVMTALCFDGFVWVAVMVCFAASMVVDDWEDGQNRSLLSTASLLVSIQLNSYVFVNAVLHKFVRRRADGAHPTAEWVSCKTIETIIDESDIQMSYKHVLKETLRSVDIEETGCLGRSEFFDFGKKMKGWTKVWQTRLYGKGLDTLERKMRFDALISNEMCDMQETARRKSRSADPVSTLLLSMKHLFTGQWWVAYVLFVMLSVVAASQYAFNFVLGELLNIAIGLAAGDETERGNYIGNILVLLGLYLASQISYYSSAYLISKMVAYATSRIQREISKRVLYGGEQFQNEFSPGALTNVFNHSLAKAESIWTRIPLNLMFPLASLASAVAFFAAVDVGYAIFVLVAIPTMFMLSSAIGGRSSRASKRQTKSSSRLAGSFQNLISIRNAAKVFQNQSFLLDRLDCPLSESHGDHFTNLLWSGTFGAIFNTVGSTLSFITTIVFLTALTKGQIDAGQFFTLAAYVQGVIKPLESLGIISSRLAYTAGPIQSIEMVIKKDKEELPYEEPSTENLPLLSVKDGLYVDKVSFRYGADLPMVLEDVSFFVKAGTYVCIFGPSGSGKSTLLGLLEGLHRCTGGDIRMDDHNQATVPLKAWRRKLGVVFQQTFVLNGTIGENIAFGYDQQTCAENGNDKVPVSIEAIIEAAKDAQIHEFIESLPNKYDTVIGSESDGILLSGGQLQSICGLARALVRKPALLILDEATSALDATSAKNVIDTVENLVREKGMTVLSVSHHTSTAVNADNIVVLKVGGSVDQTGTYADLVNSGGLFSELVDASTRESSQRLLVGN